MHLERHEQAKPLTQEEEAVELMELTDIALTGYWQFYEATTQVESASPPIEVSETFPNFKSPMPAYVVSAGSILTASGVIYEVATAGPIAAPVATWGITVLIGLGMFGVGKLLD